MKKQRLFVGLGIASILFAAFSSAPVAAQSPKFTVVTRVQNMSTNSVMADANDADNAIVARNGQVLRYQIEVSATEGEVAGVKLTDVLPDGVRLSGNAKQRTIEENLGTVTAEKITKEYKVIVESSTDQAIVDNKACVLADGVSDPICDSAIFRVIAPPKAGTTPAANTQSTTPTSNHSAAGGLPQSGAGAIAGAFVGASAFGYAAHAYRRSRQRLLSTLIRK